MIEGTVIRSTPPGIHTSLRHSGVTVGILIIGVSALYAHLRIAQIGDDYTGGLAALDRVFDAALAIGFLGGSFCVGRAIGRKLVLEFHGLAEEISFSTMVGAGAIGFGLLILGLSGALKPAPVCALMILLIAMSWREVGRLRQVLRNGVEAIGQTRTRRTVCLVFVCLITILALRAATPPHNFDEAIYHLPVPKSFVERGGIHPVYDNFGGNMPLLLHMIYAVCLMVKSDIAAKLFSLGLAVMSSLAIYGFCARFLNRRVGAIAMFGFFGAGMVVEVAVTSRIDVSLAGILFLAVYAMMVCLETRRLAWLYASAILAGFGLSIKYQAAGWLPLLLLMFVFESLFRNRDSVAAVVRHGVLFLLIAGIVASPWYVKNLVWFHSPVYPFLTGEAAEIGSGVVRYFNDEDERKIAAHFDEARAAMPEVVEEQEKLLAYAASQHIERHPFRFWEYFTAPEKFNVAERYHDPNYLFLFSPLCLFFTRHRWMIWLAVFGVGFYLFIAGTAWSGRYLLPIYPGFTVLAGYTITELTVRLKSRSRLIVAMPAIAVGIAVGASLIVCASRMHAMDAVSYLRGAISRRQFLNAMFYYPPIDFVNHNLQPEARVMMIGAQMCYDMKRDYVVDPGHDSAGWRRLLIRNATLEDLNRDLKLQGITHILYTPGQYLFSAMIGRDGEIDRRSARSNEPGYFKQQRNWATFEHYRDNFLDPIYSDERGYSVYAIK